MVYVDEPVYRLGRMYMCHMMADSSAELLAMADCIGVARRWIQKPDEPGEHFDICKAKRSQAMIHGAQAVSSRTLVKLVQARRAQKEDDRE